MVILAVSSFGNIFRSLIKQPVVPDLNFTTFPGYLAWIKTVVFAYILSLNFVDAANKWGIPGSGDSNPATVPGSLYKRG